MDIKVITRHAPSNYGSLLQSIATQKIIERLGYDCEIIDYRRKDEMGYNIIKSHLNNLKKWGTNPIKRMIYILLRFPEEYLAEKRFATYQKKYLKLTPRYQTLDELKSVNADIYMTGSDQVWGPTLSGSYDAAYFLKFVNEGKKKVAYAASFGRTNFDEPVLKKYKQLLSKYDLITVREDSAVDILKGLDMRCNGQVLDPTLLLGCDDWEKFICKDYMYGKKYILVYQLNNAQVSEYAKMLAMRTKLPVYRVTPYFHQVVSGGRMVLLPTIGKFLSCIKNCSYLVTDSFHGISFAINFKKQFMAILPKETTSTRNKSLLKLFGLENRVVSNSLNDGIIRDPIDYLSVNKKLVEERCKSIDLLKKMLNMNL